MIAALLPIAKIVGSIIDKKTEDKDLAAKLKYEVEKKLIDTDDKEAQRAQSLLLKQLEINLADAKSGKFFQSGWRPLIAWVCGAGISLQIFFFPLAQAIVPSFKTPALDTDLMLTLIVPLLGLAGARSFDKRALKKDKDNVF